MRWELEERKITPGQLCRKTLVRLDEIVTVHYHAATKLETIH
jgi:hypothetical protein